LPASSVAVRVELPIRPLLLSHAIMSSGRPSGGAMPVALVTVSSPKLTPG
jgi:hypothetical protein